MTVAKHRLRGAEVAVVTVARADSPPVRYGGRIWVRVGPRRAVASAQDERILNEKRRHGEAPFDARPVRGATLADLDLPRFRYLYLPRAFDPDVLARNDRTVEERLAATKMIVGAADPTPTVLGVLMLGPRPMDFLPGAYVQFLRFAGAGRLTAAHVDAARPGVTARVADYYQDRYRELERHKLLPAAVATAPLFLAGAEAASDCDIDEALATTGADADARLAAREALNRLGYIWEPPGQIPPIMWRAGIPSLTHVLERAAGHG